MRWVILALAVLTAGCAGIQYANQYRGIEVERFSWDGQTWRIFDKPDEGRLMITPTLLRSARQGFVGGLFFGAFDTDIPKPRYEAATIGWLLESGRECTVTDGYEVVSPQWEFTYTCQSGPPTLRVPMTTLPRPRSGAFPPVTSSGGR